MSEEISLKLANKVLLVSAVNVYSGSLEATVPSSVQFVKILPGFGVAIMVTFNVSSFAIDPPLET